MSNAVSEPSVTSASAGIRTAMIGIDVGLLIAGVALMTIGAKLNQHLATTSPQGDDLPKLWGLGIMPIVIAVTGILSAITAQKKWVVLWLVFSISISAGAYVFFTLRGFFDPSRFGVTIQVFGHCKQYGTSCHCSWQEGSYLGIMENTDCMQAKYTNCLFLVETVLVILCLACTIVCVVLGSVSACCISHCIPHFEKHSELHTAIYGVNLNMRQQLQATSLLCPPPQYLLVPNSGHAETSTCDPESSYVL